MKKIMLGFILVLIITSSQPVLADNSEKVLLGYRGEKYVTINPDLYDIDYVEYDTIKVTCVKTGKQHTFTLSKDAYQIENKYYYDSKIIADMNKMQLLDFSKCIYLA